MRERKASVSQRSRAARRGLWRAWTQRASSRARSPGRAERLAEVGRPGALKVSVASARARGRKSRRSEVRGGPGKEGSVELVGRGAPGALAAKARSSGRGRDSTGERRWAPRSWPVERRASASRRTSEGTRASVGLLSKSRGAKASPTQASLAPIGRVGSSCGGQGRAAVSAARRPQVPAVADMRSGRWEHFLALRIRRESALRPRKPLRRAAVRAGSAGLCGLCRFAEATTRGVGDVANVQHASNGRVSVRNATAPRVCSAAGNRRTAPTCRQARRGTAASETRAFTQQTSRRPPGPHR